MSNTRKATGKPAEEDQAVEPVTDTPDAPAELAPEDDLDRELAELRAQIAARQAEEADPRRQEIAKLRAQLAGDAAPEEDERDRTIRLLREQLAEKTSTEAGAAAEMRAAVRALQDQINRMQSGAGLIPVPDPDGPAPYLYGGLLANGEVVYAQYPTATHHESADHGQVPVKAWWHLDPSQYEKAQQWANEQDAKANERARELAQARA